MREGFAEITRLDKIERDSTRIEKRLDYLSADTYRQLTSGYVRHRRDQSTMIHKVLSKRTGKTTWAISVRVGGNRYRQAGFKTKEKADEYIRDLKDAYRNRLIGIEPEYERRVITLQDLFEARARDPINMSTGSRRQLLRHFADFVSIDPDLPVRDVTVSRLASYRAALMGQFKVSTIEFVISGIVAGLNSGRLYFPELETFRAPALVGLPNPGRAVLVPRAELVAVRDELRRMDRDAAADIFEMLILTGCRVMELLTLRPEWIEWERGLVGLPASATKTKSRPYSSNNARP